MTTVIKLGLIALTLAAGAIAFLGDRGAYAADGLLANAQTLSAPVLRRPVPRGDMIERADIRFAEAETRRLPRDVVLELEEIVGMVAQRNLRAGRAIRTRDVAEPLAVAKGDLVSIVYSTPFMTLTARGRALTSAPLGGVVRVVNGHSRQTIEATAVAPGLVSARPVGRAHFAEMQR